MNLLVSAFEVKDKGVQVLSGTHCTRMSVLKGSSLPSLCSRAIKAEHPDVQRKARAPKHTPKPASRFIQGPVDAKTSARGRLALITGRGNTQNEPSRIVSLSLSFWGAAPHRLTCPRIPHIQRNGERRLSGDIDSRSAATRQPSQDMQENQFSITRVD